MSDRFFFPVGLLLLCAGGAAVAASLETTTVLERGPHSQVVQTISPAVDEQGNSVSVTNTFLRNCRPV